MVIRKVRISIVKLNVERRTSNGDIPLPAQLHMFDNFPFSERVRTPRTNFGIRRLSEFHFGLFHLALAKCPTATLQPVS